MSSLHPRKPKTKKSRKGKNMANVQNPSATAIKPAAPAWQKPRIILPPDPLIVCEITDPLDVKLTFDELTRQTCPSGEEAARFAPMLTKMGWQDDGCGNWNIQVGEGFTTAFTEHLDDVSRTRRNVTKVTNPDTGLLETDGKTILGADCKAGVAIMLYMIAVETPGLYVLFREEEIGRLGSEDALRANSLPLASITKMVSFDRKGYYSVITEQMGQECCSDAFATALTEKLNDFFGWGHNEKKCWAPDPCGSYTDSASFMGVIPECTNLSVGYHYAHSESECLDLGFLTNMAFACSAMDWNELPVERDPGDSSGVFSRLAALGSRTSGAACFELMEAVIEHPEMAADIIDEMMRQMPLLTATIFTQVEERHARPSQRYIGYGWRADDYGDDWPLLKGNSNR